MRIVSIGRWLTASAICFWLVLGTGLATDMKDTDMADIAGVMQTVLNNEELSSYYHFDQVPERRPLTIVLAATQIPDSPVEVQGEAVRFDDGRGIDRQAGNFIQVTRLVVDTSLALVEIAFPAEGITGLYFLSRTGGTWHTEHASLAEN